MRRANKIHKVNFIRLTQREKLELIRHITDIYKTPDALKMKSFIQHGTTSTYMHSLTVAYFSFWLAKRFKIRVNERELARGAFLHDFYLYDWHGKFRFKTLLTPLKMHGFMHPRAALLEAEKRYALTNVEKNIIKSHMWPMTIRSVPRCREALIVCLIDKACSLAETLKIRLV